MSFGASTMEAMLGIVPVAVTGGVVLGLTKEAMKIPGMLDEERYIRRRARRGYRRAPRSYDNDLFVRLYGPPR